MWTVEGGDCGLLRGGVLTVEGGECGLLRVGSVYC